MKADNYIRQKTSAKQKEEQNLSNFEAYDSVKQKLKLCSWSRNTKNKTSYMIPCLWRKFHTHWEISSQHTMIKPGSWSQTFCVKTLTSIIYHLSAIWVSSSFSTSLTNTFIICIKNNCYSGIVYAFKSGSFTCLFYFLYLNKLHLILNLRYI